MSFQDIAQQFVDFYYKTFDADRTQLAALYRETSMLTFEKEPFQGTQAIIEKLQTLPFQKVQHRVDTMDAQPETEQGGIIVLVTESGSYFVFNDLFRLVYAAH